MSRRQFSHNYILVSLALLTLLAFLPAPTHAKTGSRVRTGVEGRGRAPLSGQTPRAGLPNRDADRVQVFRTMFLLRLFMVFQQMHLEHLPKTAGWAEVTDDYRAVEALSKEFGKLAGDDLITLYFFDENGYYFGEMAALSSEIDAALKNGSLPREYSPLLFRKLVVAEGGGVGYPPRYRHLFEPWTRRFNTAVTRLSKGVSGAFENWKQEYGFDAEQVFTPTGRLPFKLPFMEFLDDDVGVDYLYEVFIRGAGLPRDLESYYKGAFANIFRRLFNETKFKTQEVALLWAKMATARVPASLVAGVFVDLGFNCANKIRKENRAGHYQQANRLHNDILGLLAQGDQIILSLIQFAEGKRGALRYNRQKNEVYINDLKEQAEVYLKQRARLARFPKQWADATDRLTRSSRSGDSDLLNDENEMSALVDAVILRRPLEVVRKEYLKGKAMDVADPCGRLYDLIKASVPDVFSDFRPLAGQVELTPDPARPDAAPTPRGEQAGRQGSSRTRANATGSRPARTPGDAPAPRPPAEEKPPTAAELVGRAEADFKYGRYESAAAACLEALKADPDQPKANLLLGKVYYRTKEYEKSVAHLARALALGETLTLPIAHHRKVFAGKSDNGTDNDLNVGEIAVRKDRLELRFTSNVTRTGVRVSDESFSVPLERVYELKHEPDKEGRLRLVVGVAQGDGAGKEKRRTYNFYPADARVVTEKGKLMSLSDTEIRCVSCSPETRLLHDLLSSLRR